MLFQTFNLLMLTNNWLTQQASDIMLSTYSQSSKVLMMSISSQLIWSSQWSSTQWKQSFQQSQPISQKKQWRAQFNDLILEDQKKKQIKYLIDLLKSLYKLFLKLCSDTRSIIYQIWHTYNSFFSHLEKQQQRVVEYNHIQWWRDMCSAIKNEIRKMQKYYSQTDDKRGLYYNLDTVLNSFKKLSIYNVSLWE